MSVTEKLAMGLARLDPHQVAPIAMAGVFSIVRFVDNDTEGHRVVLLPLGLYPHVPVATFEDKVILNGCLYRPSKPSRICFPS